MLRYRFTKQRGRSVAFYEQGRDTAIVLPRDTASRLEFSWAWPDDLRLVVATPSIGLATAKARAALADTLPRRDAVDARVMEMVRTGKPTGGDWNYDAENRGTFGASMLNTPPAGAGSSTIVGASPAPA